MDQNAKKKTRGKINLIVLAIGISFLILVLIIGVMTRDDEPIQQVQATVENSLTVNAEQLAKEYEDDSYTAKKKYHGQNLRLLGSVSKVNIPSLENVPCEIRLSGGNSWTIIEVETDEREKVSQLKENDFVDVVGTCSVAGMATLKNSKIIKIQKYEDTEAYKQEMKAEAEKKKVQAEHQKVIAEAEKKMKQESDSVLAFTMPSDNIFYLKVKNEWYLLSESEKQYLAETIYEQVNKLSNAWFGTDAVFSIQDASGNEVATSRITGGMKIKR